MVGAGRGWDCLQWTEVCKTALEWMVSHREPSIPSWVSFFLLKLLWSFLTTPRDFLPWPEHSLEWCSWYLVFASWREIVWACFFPSSEVLPNSTFQTFTSLLPFLFLSRGLAVPAAWGSFAQTNRMCDSLGVPGGDHWDVKQTHFRRPALQQRLLSFTSH